MTTTTATINTYTTLAGEVLDLSTLTKHEREYFERCYTAWKENRTWTEISNLVTGPENPLLKETQGRITQEVWDHPLFQTIRDLEDRAGIQQGELKRVRGADAGADPIADEWVSVAEAARAKGVTRQAIGQAISRGELVAIAQRHGGRARVLSKRSLDAWQPSRVRQAAGLARAR